MEKQPIPFRRTIFVCTNVRENGVACGNPGRGGLEICAGLKAGIKEAGLKKEIRVARSGCLDQCAKGPNLFTYPDEEFLSGLSPADVPSLLKKFS